jgi:hypothetical protein
MRRMEIGEMEIEIVQGQVKGIHSPTHPTMRESPTAGTRTGFSGVPKGPARKDGYSGSSPAGAL